MNKMTRQTVAVLGVLCGISGYGAVQAAPIFPASSAHLHGLTGVVSGLLWQQTPAPAKGALTDHYSVKVKVNSMAEGEFTVLLNGEQIGSFSTDANRDITDLVKPGKNKMVVRYKASESIKNPFAQTVLTLGLERNGKWSTVANQGIRKSDSSGSKTFTFVAK